MANSEPIQNANTLKPAKVSPLTNDEARPDDEMGGALSAKTQKAEQRGQKLKAALRANLQKRKQQNRARKPD